MTPAELDAVPLELLVAAVFRRCGLTLAADMSAAPQRGHADIPVSAVSAADTSEIEQRRAHWRRQKAMQRARRAADMSADTRTTVGSSCRTTTTADIADADIGQHLPGLEHAGPAPVPAPAPPDDLTRRKLRTLTAELLARHELDRQRAAGVEIRSETAWLRTVAARKAVDQATQIADAVEAALARWTTPDAAHVASLILTPAQPRRRAHVPVTLPPRPPDHETAAGLASLRTALRRVVA